MSLTPPPALSSPPWDSRTKRFVISIVLILFAFAFMRVTDVLPLVVISALLTYLFYPLTNKLDEILPGGRGVAILATFVVLFLGFILVMLLIVPMLVAQISDFVAQIPVLYNDLIAQINQFLTQPFVFNGEPVLVNNEPLILGEYLAGVIGSESLSPTDLGQNLDLPNILQSTFNSLSGPAFSVVGGVVRTLFNLFLLITLMFYLLRDGHKFSQTVINNAPKGYQDDFRRLFYELAEIWNAYLRGQVVLGLFIGILVFIAALILGVPNPAVLGLISGLLEFVPNIGPFLALIPAALLALFSPSSTMPFLEGPTFAFVVIIVWTAIQQLESIYVVPRVLGDNLNLHPVIVILGVVAGANFGGALGVILAAPAIATIRLLLQYVYGKLTDETTIAPVTDFDNRQQQNILQAFLGIFMRSTPKPVEKPIIVVEDPQEGVTVNVVESPSSTASNKRKRKR